MFNAMPGKNCLIQQLGKVQGNVSKRVFNLKLTTPYIRLIINKEVWPAE